jgi:hypothetical protein
LALLELVNVLNSKAIDHYKHGRFSEAVRALREALFIVPDHPAIKGNLDASLAAEAAALIQ